MTTKFVFLKLMIKSRNYSSLRLMVVMLFCIALFSSTYGQNTYNEKTINIYNEGGLSVDVKFKIFNYPCGYNSKPHEYSYLIEGKLFSGTMYLTWDLELEECHGGEKLVSRSISVGSDMEARLGVQIENEDYEFHGEPFNTIDIKNVRLSSTNMKDGKPVEIVRNTLPSKINGLDFLRNGESTNLSFSDGNLSPGANWVWYQDECKGKKIGEGEELNLQVYEAVEVFLGIEGGINTVGCVSKNIDIDESSKLPSRFTNPLTVCRGQSLDLQINDGYLGPNSRWEWYIDGCEGEKIGEGNYLTVSPELDTKYYVKAVGSNPTDYCRMIYVEVTNKSESELPKVVNVPAEICSGEALKLEALDGKLAEGSEWVWYFTEDGDAKQRLGTGLRKTVFPEKTGFYLLTTEGICGLSDKYVVSNKVILRKPRFSNQYLVASPSYPTLGDKVNVRVNVATDKSKWKWTLNSKQLHTKESNIKFKIKENTTITASEIGYCTNNELKKLIIPQSSPVVTSNLPQNKVTRWYSQSGVFKKTLHFGASVGLFTTVKSYGLNISSQSVDLYKVIQLSGVEYQLTFHPIIRKRFSYGIYFNHQIGVRALSFLNKEDYESFSRRKISKMRFGNALSFGSPKFKLLLGYEKKFENLAFLYRNNSSNSLVPRGTNFMYVQNIEDEVKFGFRFLPYTNRKGKRSTTLDLLFTVFHQNNIHNENHQRSDYGFIDVLGIFDYNNLNLKYGGEFNLWMQSGIGLNFRYISGGLNGFSYSNINSLNTPYYQVSLLWNFDFYR